MKAIKISMVMLVFLVFIQIGHSQNIEFVGSYDMTNAFDVSVEWPYAYVCQHAAEPCFLVLDISEPEQPVIVGQWDQFKFLHDMEIVGDYAFLAGDFEGVIVLDISDPENPAPVGICRLPDRAYKLFIEGSLAYVCDGHAGFYILDISDPTLPVEIGFCDTPGSTGGVVVRDQIAYIPDHWDILHTIDVSDPNAPLLMGTFSGEGWARKGVVVIDDFAYVSTWDNSIYILNIEDPENPGEVGIYETPGHCLDVFVSDYLYVSDFEAGIHVLDIAAPSEPLWFGSYDTPGEARSTTISKEYIFVADVTSLQILKLTPTGIDDEIRVFPRDISILHNYPNPFNSSTIVTYELSQPGFVNLSIYNIAGQKVASLINQNHEVGAYNVTWNADDLSSGIYLARIAVGSSSKTIKMELLR